MHKCDECNWKENKSKISLEKVTKCPKCGSSKIGYILDDSGIIRPMLNIPERFSEALSKMKNKEDGADDE